MFKPPFAWVIIALLLTTTDITQAQQTTKIPRIGYLHSGTAARPPTSLKALKEGLCDLGYIEGTPARSARRRLSE